MPTDYTADGTSGLSPSSAPGPETMPIIHLPNDGESANVASIYQELKQLANEVGFLKLPFALGTSWAQAIKRFRTARGHTRFLVDHMGFPSGRFVAMQEDWTDAAFTSQGTAGSAAWAKRWRWSIQASGSTGTIVPVQGFSPGSDIASPMLTIDTPNSSPNQLTCSVESIIKEIGIGINSHVYAAWDFKDLSGLTGDVDWAAGWTTGTTVASGTLASRNLEGAYFARRNGDTNWQCVANAVGGTASYVDSGVAAGSGNARRMRIEYHGAGVSDDSAGHCIFYIDGSIVQNIAVDLQGFGGLMSARSFFFAHSAASHNKFGIGTHRVVWNLSSGDASL